ncbi:MAG: hypothetical protein M3R70_13775, partial [Actinomycetota bacterium]|nr:hypothetical protein [Actinomycetota bacterium]
RWTTSNGAARYVVRAILRDGRRSEWLLRGSRRSFVVPRVPGVDSGRILVAGISRNAMVGRPGTTRVVKRPKHRRR